jgi:hypothetical protein
MSRTPQSATATFGQRTPRARINEQRVRCQSPYSHSAKQPPRHAETAGRCGWSPKRWLGLGDVRETETITRWNADDLRPRASSSPWHQDLREGSASEALLLDDVELQVLIEIGEWAAALADRNRDRRKVVFIDETETGE